MPHSHHIPLEHLSIVHHIPINSLLECLSVLHHTPITPTGMPHNPSSHSHYNPMKHLSILCQFLCRMCFHDLNALCPPVIMWPREKKLFTSRIVPLKSTAKFVFQLFCQLSVFVFMLLLFIFFCALFPKVSVTHFHINLCKASIVPLFCKQLS